MSKAILPSCLVCTLATMILALAANVFAEQREVSDATTAPEGMIWIPASKFTMGNDDPTVHPNEHPSHPVCIDGFWIDRSLVTNAQYAKFVEATGYITVAERPVDWDELKKQLPPGTEKPPADALAPGSLVFTPPNHPVPLQHMANWWTWVNGANWRNPEGPGSDIFDRMDHPVVQVAYEDVTAYCEWIGKRLPTEAEWEFASRGGTTTERFFWGDEFTPGGAYMANTFQGKFPYEITPLDGYPGTSPVNAFPANGYGLHDMAGNVWQWTSDWYRYDAYREANTEECAVNPTGPPSSYDPNEPRTPKRVIKGGSFLCHVSYCESYRPTARRGGALDTGAGHIGFRCAMSPEESETPSKEAE